jgi:hypothetical protein
LRWPDRFAWRSKHGNRDERLIATEPTGADSLSATTGAAGRFAFPRVPFGRYTLHASTPDGPVDRSIDVATGTVVDIDLLPTRVIGSARATMTGVHGTPIAVNTITAAQIATLPVNTSIARVIETLPGVVRFSYDEPVVDGFHGVTYELDGAPLPSSTSSNFANLIDPRTVGAVETFTGAFPAEFGGQRMGAVVNVRSLAFANPAPPGLITLGAAELGTQEGQLQKQFSIGRVQVSLAADNLTSDRGLDTPAENTIHDTSSTANQFLRIGLPLNARDSLALDLANQYATYQVPINTDPTNLNAGSVSLLNQDDVQREYDRFAALSFTRDDADGNGYLFRHQDFPDVDIYEHHDRAVGEFRIRDGWDAHHARRDAPGTFRRDGAREQRASRLPRGRAHRPARLRDEGRAARSGHR